MLLILAEVALATLTGDSGILSNSDKAKEETLKQEMEQQEEVNIGKQITYTT